jgi:drug/metabolite transporter (DMT)-like permease
MKSGNFSAATGENDFCMSNHPEHKKWTGLISLLVVYVVWGSTYLAIRYAVREGSGFPVFWMAGSRIMLGGVILLVVAAVTRQSFRMTRSSWVVTVVSAILMWNGGNGLVTWAEQGISSGYAALVIGTTPLWGVIIESILHRRLPTIRAVSSLLIGFAGLAVLTAPMIRTDEPVALNYLVALICAPVSWAVGSAYQQRRQLSQPIVVSSAYQQLVGGLVFMLLAVATREPWPQPTVEAWWAWGYLVVFGSVFAFTAYVTALRALPLPMVMTYAYVNPLIAVFLGWLFLKESITWHTLVGTLLILAGVAALFREKFAARKFDRIG